VLSQFTRVTDGRTDRRTDGRTDRILITIPRLHYMQRGKNEMAAMFDAKEASDIVETETADSNDTTVAKRSYDRSQDRPMRLLRTLR